MPNKTPTSQRVMLLLPTDLAQFVDSLAEKLSEPGLKLNRQDAIRRALSRLMTETQDTYTRKTAKRS